MLVVIGLLALAPLVIRDAFYLRLMTEGLMWIGMAITWDLIGGYTGYVNFGHGVFFGFGAYATAILMVHANFPFFAALPCGGIMAGLVALVTGVPTLRLQGAYFAIGTWAFNKAAQQFVLVLDITGGPEGMRLPPFLNPTFFVYVMLFAVGATFFILWYFLEQAPFGLKLKAIREDEAGSRAIGLNPTVLKLKAYVLSAAPVGIFGGVYAYWITFIDPASVMGDLLSDQAVVMALVGGLGTLIGPVIGAILFFGFKTFFWTYLAEFQVLYIIIMGLAIMLSVLFLPDGIVGAITGRREGRAALKKGLAPLRINREADEDQKNVST
jgi:branched-chain amino acid transport system permease protein